MKSLCRPNSAWHSWQQAGEVVKGKPMADIEAAAHEFASLWGDSYTPAYGARYRAFMEGATS